MHHLNTYTYTVLYWHFATFMLMKYYLCTMTMCMFSVPTCHGCYYNYYIYIYHIYTIITKYNTYRHDIILKGFKSNSFLHNVVDDNIYYIINEPANF